MQFRISIIIAEVILFYLALRFAVEVALNTNFWADDFHWGSQSVSPLNQIFHPSFSDGRPISNVAYWQISTKIYGFDSAFPYILSNLICLFLALLVLLATYLEIKKVNNIVFSQFFVLAVFVNSTFYSTIFWASNITHCLGFLFLSFSLYFQMKPKNKSDNLYKTSIVIQILLIFSILSNPQLVLASVVVTFFDLHKLHKIRKINFQKRYRFTYFLTIIFTFGSIYFSAMGTLQKGNYEIFSRELFQNLNFYWENISSNNIIAKFAMIVMLTIAFIQISIELRSKILKSLELVFIALSAGLPALVQPQQKALQYMLVPYVLIFIVNLLFFQSLGNSSEKSRNYFYLRIISFIICLLFIYSSFTSSINVRKFFKNSPYGTPIAQLNSSINRNDSNACLVFLTESEKTEFIVQTSNGGAMLKPFGFYTDIEMVIDKNLCAGHQNVILLQRDSEKAWTKNS